MMRMIDGGKPLRKVQTQDVSFVLDFTAAAIDDTTGFSQKKAGRLARTTASSGAPILLSCREHAAGFERTSQRI